MLQRELRSPIRIGSVWGDYAIGRCIGGGGSGLCYEAFHIQNGGKVILKEIYPSVLAEKGLIQRNDATQKLNAKVSLSAYHHAQETEVSIIQTLRDARGHNSPYILEAKFFHHNGVRYTIIDTSGGDILHSLHRQHTRQGLIADLPTLKDVLLRVQRILEAIGPIHQAGYLHGDLSPDNLFVSTLEQGCPSRRTILCIDFNSAFLLTQCPHIHATGKIGYAPPELQGATQALPLSFGSDLYSVGAILYEMLHLCPAYFPPGQEAAVLGDVPTLPYFEGQTPDVCRKTWALLHRSMVGRIQAQGDTPAWRVFWQEIAQIIHCIDHPHRWGKTWTPVDIPTVGRKAELSAMAQILSAQKIPVLHGIGGIGKSHLSKAFVKAHCFAYDTVLFLPYAGSLRKTILSDQLWPITNVSLESVLSAHPESNGDNDKKENIYLAEKIQIIQRLLTPRTLLILDGMDTVCDPLLDTFCQWPCAKIITTRNDFSANTLVQTLNIGEIQDMDALKALFFQGYPPSMLRPGQAGLVEALIHAVCHHTLTVVLMAKSAYASDTDLAELLSRIQGATMHLPQERILYDHNGQMMDDTAETIIQTIFDLSVLRQEQRHLLRHLCLLPSAGIARSQLKQWMELPDLNDLNDLVRSGWLFFDPARNQVSLHQIIAHVCRKKLQPDGDACATFLQHLAQDCQCAQSGQYETYLQNCQIFQSVAAVLAHTQHPLFHSYALEIARLHLAFGNFPLAQTLFQTVEQACQDGKNRYIAQSFLLTIAVDQGDKPQAKQLVDTVAQSPYFPLLKDRELAFYQNKAWLYFVEGDQTSIQSAIDLLRQCLATHQETQGMSLAEKRQYYQTQYILANAYYRMAAFAPEPCQAYAKAQEWVECAIANKKTTFPQQHHLTFADYNLLGECLVGLGHLHQAYQLHQELLAKKLRHFPPHVLTMAIAYRNLAKTGYTLYLAGQAVDVRQILDYITQGIAIAKALPRREMVLFLYDMQLRISQEEGDGALQLETQTALDAYLMSTEQM